MNEEQGRQEVEKTEISLAEILFLNPEDEKKLHPHALKRFDDWRKEIFNEVPHPEKLTIDEFNADINTYLNDADKAKAAKYRDNVSTWLGKCIDIGNVYSRYSPVYDTSVISDMSGLKQLVKTAYERKEEKAREEEREREEDRQWKEAALHVYPLQLSKDANRYLNKDELDKLYDAVNVAIEVFLKEGDSYLHNYKTLDYCRWLKTIIYRKDREQRRLDAEAQAEAFRPRLAEGLKDIESKLSPRVEDPTETFKRYCSDKGETRYLRESFADILGGNDDRKKNWTQGFIPPAEKELNIFIPEELRDFVLTKPKATFFLLPSATYSYCGVPCLDFYFDVFAVVTIAVSAQAGQKVFNGYKFDLLTNLREPKPLGIYQIIITSNEPHFWQSVPVTIIHALMDGNLQPPGVIILQRTNQFTVYEVNKFEENICEIPISFERYYRSLGSIEKMKEAQIINERTAEMLEPPQPISINHKESKSKKSQAFQLFDADKRPSDFEVKSLGIKPETAYRYYQDWKKTQDNSNNSN